MKKLNRLLIDAIEFENKVKGDYVTSYLCTEQRQYFDKLAEQAIYEEKLSESASAPFNVWEVEPTAPEDPDNYLHVCTKKCRKDAASGYRNTPLTEVGVANEIARLLRTNLRFNAKLNDKKGAWEFRDNDDDWIQIDGETAINKIVQDYVLVWNRIQSYIVETQIASETRAKTEFRQGETKLRNIQDALTRFKESEVLSDDDARVMGLQKGRLMSKEEILKEQESNREALEHQLKNIKMYVESAQATIDSLKDSVVDLKELKSKHERFNTEAGTRAICNLLKAFLPVHVETANVVIGSDGDYMNTPIQTPLVDGLFPRTGLGQIYGDSGVGKSFASVSLALSVATGQSSWGGRDLKVNGPTEVFYIAAEGGEPWSRMIKSWKVAHGMDPETPIPTFKYLDFENVGSNGSRLELTKSGLAENDGMMGVKDLQKYLKETMDFHPKLIIIDPQANVTSGVDENSKSLMDVLLPLKYWANDDKSLILLVHHTGKDGAKGARGSSSQKAMMDVQAWFKDGDGDKRSIEFTKVKGMRLPKEELEFEFTDIPGDMTHLKYTGVVESKQEQAKQKNEGWKFRVLQILDTEDGEPMSGSKIAQVINPGNADFRKNVNQFLTTLEAEGKAFNAGNQNRPKWFKTQN